MHTLNFRQYKAYFSPEKEKSWPEYKSRDN